MRPRPRSPRADLVLLVWLLSLLFAGMANAAGPARDKTVTPAVEQLVLAVTLNGTPADADPVLVRRQGKRLTMRTADLRALGVPVRGDAPDTPLADVPGLGATIDDAAQVIALTWQRHRARLRGGDLMGDEGQVTPNGWGAAINYDLAATHAGGRTTIGGLVDAIVYGPRGYFYGSAVVADSGAPTLLDAGFTVADPARARRLTLGDFITGATDHSRPVRMLGVQVATDFDLRPDLVTTPLPMIDLGAGVPSATDVIVNGQHQGGTPAAGRFALTDLPVSSGVNTVTVTTRDALGRETRQTLSAYVSPVLLRSGLTAASAEAGLVRLGYGRDDRYGALAGMATLRAGLSDRLTIDAHGELSGRVGVGGVGAAMGLGTIGLLSASAAASVASPDLRRGGFQWSLGYERLARPFSIAARYTSASPGWRDLAGDGGTPTRSHVAVLTLGFDLKRLGNIGVTVIDQGSGHAGRPSARIPVPQTLLEPSRFINASWSTRVASRVNLIANAGTDTRQRRSRYLSIGALLLIGARQNGYAGVMARDGATTANARWSQTAIEPGDWGYTADVATGGGLDRQAGEVAYQGDRGRYAVQLERVNGAVAERVAARGAIAIGGDGVLAADRLTGSFAVVDTGRPGVTVYRDHRPVGVTDGRGKLLVRDLPAFTKTDISLDPLQLDDDVAPDVLAYDIRPATRAGVKVRFDLRPSRAATVRLLLADGTPVPAGARASLNGGEAVPVGLDGETWLTALRPTNRLHVTQAGRALCTASFTSPAPRRPGASIGAVTCAAISPSTPSATPPPRHPPPPGSPVAAAPVSPARAAPPPRDGAIPPPPA